MLWINVWRDERFTEAFFGDIGISSYKAHINSSEVYTNAFIFLFYLWKSLYFALYSFFLPPHFLPSLPQVYFAYVSYPFSSFPFSVPHSLSNFLQRSHDDCFHPNLMASLSLISFNVNLFSYTHVELFIYKF